MFGIGFEELVVVLVAALVLINPKDLPKLFRKAGKLWGRIRQLRETAENTARDVARDIRIGDKEGEKNDRTK